ncbi:MAG: hypothetical protein ABIQ15_03350 [Nocardioides sp.]
MRKLRNKPSPALAVSIVALVVAMGGTSYAAIQIGSQDIKNNSIQSNDIKDKAIKGRDLAKNSMNRGKIKKNAVNTVKVADGSLLGKDFKAGQLPAGPQGPQGPQGLAGSGRWVLINAAGAIEAQSGGFTITSAYPALPSPGNGNVYINANEPLGNNGIVASIALQNTVDQNGDGIQNGTVATPDSNPEFSGEIAVSQCAPTGTSVTNCAPTGTNNVKHFVVSPRNSDGTRTDASNRKRFYVIITGDSRDFVAP